MITQKRKMRNLGYRAVANIVFAGFFVAIVGVPACAAYIAYHFIARYW